jgi:hypothetical protein
VKAIRLRRRQMQEKRQKYVVIGLEVVSLAILLPVVYWFAVKLLIEPIGRYIFEDIPTWLVFFIVLGFDVGWVVIMRLWPLKNMNIKIILTLLVLTLSASVLTCLVVLSAMRGAFV